MKTTTATTYCSAAALSLLTATGAFASSAAGSVSTNKVLVSGPLILLFLGFCALVVVVQLIPAAITLYGLIKGALGGREKDPAGAKAKY